MKKVKSKKKYGQNFLKDEEILDKIIESIPNNNNKIVEIGSGLGDLTKKMVKYKHVRAYEIDIDLVKILIIKFLNEIRCNKLKVIHQDVLKVWDDEKTLINCKYDLIANLPYYIATNIILRAFEDNNCEHMIVMVQKEVALRFSANNGDKQFSAISVIAQLQSLDVKILFDVQKTSFEPQPNVVSSVLYIKKIQTLPIKQDFKIFLRAAFSQPRKKLLNNLCSIAKKETLHLKFFELNISPDSRPHQLSSSLYKKLYQEVNKNGKRNEKQHYSNKK